MSFSPDWTVSIFQFYNKKGRVAAGSSTKESTKWKGRESSFIASVGLLVGPQPAGVGKSFSAVLAHIRALIGMAAHVDLEVVGAREVFSAFGPIARVGFRACMGPVVGREGARGSKGSFAASPLTFPSLGCRIVGHFVDFEARRVGEGRRAARPVTAMIFRARME